MSEPRQGSTPRGRRRRSLHFVIVILGPLACVLGILNSGREGLAALLSSYALTMNRPDAADRAIRLSPSNSEAHYARASLLAAGEQWAEAVKAYEQAASLRPRDYVLVLELGRARDQANDTAGALAAFREAARLAPFYARSHWLLGNLLLRSGQRDEALAELNRAATSDPSLLPATINFSWVIFNGDAPAVERALQPQTTSAHVALASFFARHAKASEAVAQLRAAGTVSDEQRRGLLTDLLSARSFAEAFEVWSSGRPGGGKSGRAVFSDGGFEEPIALDDPGFGWQAASNLPTVRTSLDPSQPHSGAYSLRLDWSGDSDPATPVISQLVLVEPKTRYRLSFAARTQEMISIGLPVVVVIDPSGDNQRVLESSASLPQGTNGWQVFTMEFATGEAQSAVLIAMRRQTCPAAPCAILGHLWVDDFSLEKQ